MTSKVSENRRLLALLVLGVLACTAQAPAPQGTQVETLPNGGPPVTGAPVPASPPESSSHQNQGGAEEQPSTSSAVSVSAIGNVDGPTVGLLDDNNGGLGQDMWSGSARADLESELSRIPIVTTDPVVRDLARRILLTRADTPIGPSHHPLITVRLQRLLDGGLLDEAGELASKVDLPSDGEVTQLQAEALLYAGRTSDICSDKTNRRLQSGDSFWLELRSYCYIAQGDAAAADLTRSILDAQPEADTGFPLLIDALNNSRPVPPGAMLHPTAVDIFLLRKLGLAVTPQVASQLGTPANVIAARDLRNPPIERLSAAEHILSTGALAAGDLVTLADAQTFSSAQRASIREQAGRLPFLTRQILFRQATALESRPVVKLALIRRADPALNESGPFTVFAQLQTSNVLAISPNATLGQTSWLAARVLMIGRRPESAAAWLSAPNNPLTAQAGIALDLLAPSAANDSLAQNDVIWLAAHATTEAGGWPAATALAIGIWNALGRTLPPDAIQKGPIVSRTFDGDLIEPSQMSEVNTAAAVHQRRGEAVLRLLNIIGTRGPARFAPDASAYLVATLEHLGLDSEARQVAAECLLLGPPLPSTPPAKSSPSTASTPP